MKRSSLLTSAAVLSAAGLSAATAALVRRLLRHGAVDHAVRVSTKDADTGQLPVASPKAGGIPPSALPGWQENLPVTPVPPNTVTATAAETPEAARDSGNSAGWVGVSDAGTETGGDAGSGSATDGGEPRPARTWVVDNSSAWDGSPLEMVVPPGRRLRKGHPGAAPA